VGRSRGGFILRIIRPEDDKYKSLSTIQKQLNEDWVCSLDGCNEPVSMYTGPNADKLCRPHQTAQREYGGTGRIDRPWTFAREWTCSCCGYNPKGDEWFDHQTWDSEYHKLQAMRSMLVADHIVRKADGGGHEKENIQTLCMNCNAKKTLLHNDHRRSVFL